jgi:hypothetical protein
MTNLLTRLAWTGISLSTVGFCNIFSQPAYSQSATTSATTNDYIGNQGVQFQEDTIVEFEFIKSHGAYQSTFGVIDLDSCQTTAAGNVNLESCDKTPLLAETKPSDISETVIRQSTYESNLEGSDYDFVGTPGNAVPVPMAEYTFQGGKKYVFYLESYYNGRLAGIVYTADPFNEQSNRQALFNEEIPVKLATRRNIPNSQINQFDSLVNGGLLLKLDDTGSALVKNEYQDLDFDDFVVGIGGYQNCFDSEEQRSQNLK